jgi:hypothetical protein
VVWVPEGVVCLICNYHHREDLLSLCRDEGGGVMELEFLNIYLLVVSHG